MASVEEIFSQIKDDGSLTAKDFVQKLFFDNESDDLLDLKNDFKSKFIQPLLRKVKSIKPEDIKKITDPLGISELNDENFSENIKKIKNKIKEFSSFKIPNFLNFNQTTKEKLKKVKDYYFEVDFTIKPKPVKTGFGIKLTYYAKKTEISKKNTDLAEFPNLN